MQPPAQVRYEFNRSACFGWAAFCFVLAAVCLALGVFASSESFVRGAIPGWLLGGFGTVLMTAYGISWANRYRDEGPALELTEQGIRSSPRLGGPGTPKIDGTLRWQAVSGVEAGRYDSIIIRLRNPNAFWARQGRIDRILAWNPLRGDRLALGGNDIAHESSDVIARISDWIEWYRLSSGGQARNLPGTEKRSTSRGHGSSSTTE
jgi:hypothetical protein